MDNDCPVCEGRKKIITRDYRDCERDEPCPHCSDATKQETTAELLERMEHSALGFSLACKLLPEMEPLVPEAAQHLADIKALRANLLKSWCPICGKEYACDDCERVFAEDQ